jgi:hypothetical protein
MCHTATGEERADRLIGRSGSMRGKTGQVEEIVARSSPIKAAVQLICSAIPNNYLALARME